MFTKENIEQYFFAYKQLHLMLWLLGMATCILSAIFYWAIKTPFYIGAAIGLISFSFATGSYGYTQYKNADRLCKVNLYNYDMHPEYLKTKELPRIEKQKKQLTIIGILHTLLLATGLFFSRYYWVKNKMLAGIFTSIFFMCIIILGACVYLKNKTTVYKKEILNYTSVIKIDA